MNVVVPIVFGFDEAFTIPAGVCITSLLENALKTTSYEIHVISRDLKVESKDQFARMVDSHPGNHRVVFHDPGSAYVDDPATVHFTTAMYYRFLIPGLLEECERAIYSDVDVVFLEDISHLMEIDLGDDYLAAVTAKYVVHLMEKSLRKSNIEYLRDRYFASGFLVLNMKVIRRDRLVETIERLIRGNRYEFPDNDALNVACSGRVTYLHLKYCVPPFVEDFSELDTNRLDEGRKTMLAEAIERPSIIHYLGPDKPWHGHVLTQYERYWWDYYRKSSWYDRWYFLKNGLLRRARCQVRAARKKIRKKIRWG
ncbi:MAG: glycosyltransferase family 8 protein [Deltaproteobacteria bacterium]|jgi:UDP-glucose:(galactosyl)LPS alpha-1,2-glucosyltransferase|nr:MAG: glycosyltransferase family 8 protein [Deltaproteobacteria bacterium]